MALAAEVAVNLGVLGSYPFTLSPSVAGGDLRPLRDPNLRLLKGGET